MVVGGGGDRVDVGGRDGGGGWEEKVLFVDGVCYCCFRQTLLTWLKRKDGCLHDLLHKLLVIVIPLYIR